MAKQEFKTTKDGNGKVRFFVDGAEQLIDEYILKYVKAHGEMPEIPVGLGGRAAPVEEPVVENPEVTALKQQVADLAAKVEALQQVEQLDTSNQGMPTYGPHF